MDAISNTAQTPPLPTPVTQTESEVSTAALASDFETFLKLLTTQLQNQDPSKPLDSTEFVAQLASFSAVEQQINTNTKLDELISRINYGNTSDLSSWLGANVKSEANANFSGSPIDVFYKVPDAATYADLVVYDTSGKEIARQSVDIAGSQTSWTGLDAASSPYPDGSYRFKIESFENNKSTGLQLAQTFSPVVEARIDGNSTQLIFADGTKMAASEVQAVRGP